MVEKHKVASTDDLSDGDRIITEVYGQEIAVFRIDGEYHAVANFCVHESGPLCEGELTCEITDGDDGFWGVEGDGEIITCPWHSWQFEVKTGANVQSDRYKVPTYETEIRDDDIFVVR